MKRALSFSYGRAPAWGALGLGALVALACAQQQRPPYGQYGQPPPGAYPYGAPGQPPPPGYPPPAQNRRQAQAAQYAQPGYPPPAAPSPYGAPPPRGYPPAPGAQPGYPPAPPPAARQQQAAPGYPPPQYPPPPGYPNPRAPYPPQPQPGAYPPAQSPRQQSPYPPQYPPGAQAQAPYGGPQYAGAPGYQQDPYLQGGAEYYQPGEYEHDGFYLRMSALGIGYLHRGSGYANGLGLNLIDAAAGYTVVPNFVVFGQAVVGPGFRIGAGVAYYLMPINMFFGGGLLLQALDRISGVGIQGQFGKEWYVSPKWSIGGMATLNVGVMDGYNPVSFITNFIATFN
jgi:hypothetical protein